MGIILVQRGKIRVLGPEAAYSLSSSVGITEHQGGGKKKRHSVRMKPKRVSNQGGVGESLTYPWGSKTVTLCGQLGNRLKRWGGGGDVKREEEKN